MCTDHPPTVILLNSRAVSFWTLSASWKRKHDWQAGKLIHRENSTRKEGLIISMYKIKERVETDEKIVSLWNYHALQKHSVCMVVLMLHHHKTQYKPSKYIRVTASAWVYIYVWSDRKAALQCNNTNMQIMVLKYVSGQDEMWLAVVWNAWHCAPGWICLWRSAQWQMRKRGREVCSQGEDMRDSGGNRAEERKQQRRSREQVLLTWGGKGCRLGIPSSG